MLRSRWPGLLLLAGVGAGAAVAVAALWEPSALAGDGVQVVSAVALVLTGYVVVAPIALHSPSKAQARGVVFGLAAGAMWLVEIAAGGPVLLPRGFEVAIGAAFALAAVATTMVAGVWAAHDSGSGAGLWTGSFAGLVSGLVVFTGGVLMTLSFMERLGARADYQHQLAHSGLPSMRAFLVQDGLTGYGAHLLINPAIGLLGGVLGWLLARDSRRVPAEGEGDQP
jgi:hypothetical protein